jgi:hypothetical protein
MHQSILKPLHVMADKTAINTIQCTMIFGQHVLIQSTAITLKFLLTLKHVLEFHILWTMHRDTLA